jgi:glycosyltransferase involved in cell wall biosynthesis
MEAGLEERWNALSQGALAGRLTLKSGLTAPQVADELALATMMVFPTRADTSPNAVKEAVVAGLPVVGTKVGGIPDYVTHGENGILVDYGDVDALVTGIEAAFADARFSKGEVCPQRLELSRQWLSPKLMHDKFLAAYRKIVRSV